MTTPLTVLLGNYPHTRPLKDGSVPVDGSGLPVPGVLPAAPGLRPDGP